MIRSTRTFVVLAAALAALLGVAALSVQAAKSSRKSGGRAVAHSAGRVVKASSAPQVKTYSVGTTALEPTLGLDPAGTVYYAAAGFNNVGLASTEILRSKNGGKTWEVASPRVLDQNTMPLSLDPYVWVDENIDGDNSRIFTIDLTVACSYMSFSDDGGDTWITNPLACGRPVNDHQTLFGGPPATTSPVGYPNLLYYCWNDVATSSCSKSIDGGLTFAPTGSTPYAGYEQGNEDQGFYGQNGFCGGLHGHGAVGPEGTVYLPREFCGKPMISVSHDEGLTWEVVEVSKIRSTSQPDGGAGHPTVTTDEKGNVYYVWIGADDRRPYMAVSRDKGKSWSKPIAVGPPGLKESNLPQVDARGPGKVAIVYYGSENSPFQRCARECNGEDYASTTWNGYIAITADALAKSPTFYTGLVNTKKDPLVRAQCGPGRCYQVFDFIDVEIGGDGIAYGAFVDGCTELCTEVETAARQSGNEGLISKLVGGPRLN